VTPTLDAADDKLYRLVGARWEVWLVEKVTPKGAWVVPAASYWTDDPDLPVPPVEDLGACEEAQERADDAEWRLGRICQLVEDLRLGPCA
jgi:hypothetical protein